MSFWFHNAFTNSPRQFFDPGKLDRVRVGRAADCEIVLNSPFVHPLHAILHRRDYGWLVEADKHPCKLDGEDLRLNSPEIFPPDKVLEIPPFRIQVERGRIQTEGEDHRAREDRLFEFVASVHRTLVEIRERDPRASGRENDPSKHEFQETELQIKELLQNQFADDMRRLRDEIAGRCLRSEIVSELVAENEGGMDRGVLNVERHWSRFYSENPELERSLAALKRNFAERIGFKGAGLSERLQEIEDRFWQLWNLEVRAQLTDNLNYFSQRFMIRELKDILFGYGPIEELLRSPVVKEIMVVSAGAVYVEKETGIERSGKRFLNDDKTLLVIERILRLTDRRLNEVTPMVDARTASGDRVNAIIPPLAISGPCLTIRKFPVRRLTIADLTRPERGTLDENSAEFLRACVAAKCNLLVAGGTGTGKTTMLNCLSNFIGSRERVVTIEDTAELRLAGEHVVRLESRPADSEGKIGVSIQDLVRNALRMRPDRIIVGECRGPEAMDMLQAMNTGHDGSMSTIHANDPSDVLGRLEVMVLKAYEMPITAIHRQIASAVELVVQMGRRRKGNRYQIVVTAITELEDVDPVTGRVLLRHIFRRMRDDGVVDDSGDLQPTGRLPTFIDRLLATGTGRGGMSIDILYPSAATRRKP
jgi:Flp pilus assembly CpaF family ATPase